jgi:hypothetical protein
MPDDPNIIDKPPMPGMGGMSGTAACTPGSPPATTRFFRLTHKQYDNSIRALTGLSMQPSLSFPSDQTQAGFDRGMDLEVGDVLGKGYRSTAEAIAAQVVASADAYQKVTGCALTATNCAAATFITNFGLRVYRRPLTDAEKTGYMTLFGQGTDLVDGTATAFQKGVQTVVEAMLQSPYFLYRVELATQQADGLVVLGGYEIASRLSFMLQNGPPDDVLLEAARMNQLGTAEAIAAQARRLIETPAGRLTVRDFHHQWLGMEDYANHLAKDPMAYPTVNADLAPVLADETERFVEEVTFTLGKGWTSLVTAPFTFVNRVTAPLYGVSGSFNDSLQRADLNPAQRAGLFTQLGFLAVNAYSNQSSPIHRGVFIFRQVLCGELAPPTDVMVPDLPALQMTQTTRQQVEAHTGAGTCGATCHGVIINPIGYGFENYDAVGKYRTMENGASIDANGKLAGTAASTPFTDGVTASRAIAESPEARSCYARTWLRYSFGRTDTTGDSCAVAALATNLGDDGYKVTDLLVDMTRTKAFMFRAPGGN